MATYDQTKGGYEFDDSLNAQVGEPTKASQYNDLVENTLFLLESAAHLRAFNGDAVDAKPEDGGGAIYHGCVILNTGAGQPAQTKKLIETNPGDAGKTVPPDLRWRHIAIIFHMGVAKDASGDLSNYLPRASSDHYINNPDNWTTDAKLLESADLEHYSTGVSPESVEHHWIQPGYSYASKSGIIMFYSGDGQAEPPDDNPGALTYGRRIVVPKPWDMSDTFSLVFWVGTNGDLYVKLYDNDGNTDIIAYLWVFISPKYPG